MTVRAIKGMRGDLRCETEFDLGNRRILQIETSRDHRKRLTTNATVFNLTTDGCGRQHAFDLSGKGTGDFRKQLACSVPARATAKVIEAQHAAALVEIEAVKAEALRFYEGR